MKEFMLLFRQPSYDYSQLSPREMQDMAKKWRAWTGGIAQQEKVVSFGPRLAMEGKVLHAGGAITDGPFVEFKEHLGSFMIINAENIEEAVTLAHGCPAIDMGGSVEIRPLYNEV